MGLYIEARVHLGILSWLFGELTSQCLPYRMPELPEVEYARRLLETHMKGRTFAEVTCADDPVVIEGVSPEELGKTLTGRTVLAAHRHGKYLWLRLDRSPWPLFHLGMTGEFRLPRDIPLRLESSPKVLDDTWPPKFTKVFMKLDDGVEIAFVNKRRFGRVRLVADITRDNPVAALGFDPLNSLPPLDEFRRLLAERRGVIKGVLLDQSFAAGVGNWIADEILYQARIDPRRRAGTLSEDDVAALYRALETVIEHAVQVNADKDRFPETWLFHHRWDKKAGATTAKGEPIQHITVAGRTTAYVPSVQR